MKYTLFKNDQPVIYGLSRKTYLITLENIRRKSGLTASIIGEGLNLWVIIGSDTYQLVYGDVR